MLAAQRGLVHLEMDYFRQRLLPDAAHTRQDRIVAYRAMHLAAELLLARGIGVILNAGYSHACDRREVEEIARRTSAPLYLVEFRISPETAVERSRRRRALHPGLDLTEERVRTLVLEFPYFRKGLLVDGEAPADETLARIQNYLSTGAPLAPGLWTGAGI